MIFGDTIVAISSASGPGARMIVRLSGPQAVSISGQFWEGIFPQPFVAARGSLSLLAMRVPAWCFYFRAPASYTAEDCVEFHIPGNPLLAKMLLTEILRAGARPADAGEFTARAYFNGRMDLTEAEGVAATIAACSEDELSAARRLLSGELSRRLAPAVDQLANTLALLEVGIDFSEEDVTFLAPDEVAGRIATVDQALSDLLAQSSRFERLAHEPSVVLVGRPNAGKSTLLNALAGRERAVVSPVAGTTRDILSTEVALRRGIVRVLDVAGIEETGDETLAAVSSDGEQRRVDLKMREHAVRAIEEADRIVLVQDLGQTEAMLEIGRVPALVVYTKSDLHPDVRRPLNYPTQTPDVVVGARGGFGMQELRERLDALCFGATSAASSLALNVRHVQAIDESRAALERGAELVNVGPEFIATELRSALNALGQITGHISPDDLLGRVFSAFCIGK